MRVQCVTTMYVCLHHNVYLTLETKIDDNDDDDISDCILVLKKVEIGTVCMYRVICGFKL
jgi:hypothetical protein